MSLYDSNFVDDTLKWEMLEMLQAFVSERTIFILYDVSEALVTRRCSGDGERHPSRLDEIWTEGQDGQDRRVSFLKLLWEEGEWNGPETGLVTGSEELTLSSPNRFLDRLEELSYPVRLNTWLAVCEVWLQVSGAEWYPESFFRDERGPLFNCEDRSSLQTGYLEFEESQIND